MFFRVRVDRAQHADVDHKLLTFGGETVALEQPRGVRIGRVLEDAVGPTAIGVLRRIDPTGLPSLQDRACILPSTSRAGRRAAAFSADRSRTDLHDLLLGEFSVPSRDRAPPRRSRLRRRRNPDVDHLAGHFGSSIGKTFGALVFTRLQQPITPNPTRKLANSPWGLCVGGWPPLIL